MYEYKTDERGFTHIYWTLEGVTAKMMNWHWSNLDKDYMLWHPVDHEGFCWAVPVTPEKFIGAVHKTLQGERAKIYSDPQDSPVGLAYLDPAILTPDIAQYIIHDYAVVVGPIKAEDIGKEMTFDNALSFRIHQWSTCPEGIVGITSAITPNPRDPEEEKKRTEAWLVHGQGELAYFEDFLAPLYTLWKPVKHAKLNPYHDLAVEHASDGTIKYKTCK